jgi:protein kinase-like protein
MNEAVRVAGVLPSGYVLHEYRIESLLGTGSFGLTYLATDTNLSSRVALKEYLPEEFAERGVDNAVQPKLGAATESFQWGLRRFMDEARTLASLRHPNIVRVMRFFEANSTGYMVMELAEGKPLPEWIQARRPLPQEALLALVLPLLDGLEAIHKSQYLHRDIKPTNILVRGDGSPVLLDFGSARRLDGDSRELTVVVTPGYAPFEQYHTQGKQGPWSDLYALGGVMYWMVTGDKPVEAAARVREDTLPPAKQATGAQLYSAGLLAAIDWALKPHENERPQGVADFRRALLGEQTTPSDDPIARPAAAAAPTAGARPVESAAATGPTGVVLDRQLLERIETDLAKQIGPIASAVVKLAAAKARDETHLHVLVAEEIEGLAQRAREEATAKAESQRKAQQEAEEATRARAEAEAKVAAELKAREEADGKAREAKVNAEAERQIREKAEAYAKAEIVVLQERALRAAQEARAKTEAERKARKEAEEATRARMEAEAIAEAQRKAREEAVQKASETAEQALQAQAKAAEMARAEERSKRVATAADKWLKIAALGAMVLAVAVLAKCA